MFLFFSQQLREFGGVGYVHPGLFELIKFRTRCFNIAGVPNIICLLFFFSPLSSNYIMYTGIIIIPRGFGEWCVEN